MKGWVLLAALAAVAVPAGFLVAGLPPAEAPPHALEPFIGPLLPQGWPDPAPDEGVKGPDPLLQTTPPGVARTEAYSILVGGQAAQGLVGLPPSDVAPVTLAVFAHPWGGVAVDYEDELRALAQRGVLTVAMEFRGA